MNNTRITDPEVLEQRYPCLLRVFQIRTQRRNSGGLGKWSGGDRLMREIQLQSPVHVSLVTQRRVYSPWGIYGGECGKKGENYLGRMRENGSIQWIRVPPLAEMEIHKGDILRNLTPGDGDFGRDKRTEPDEFWRIGDNKVVEHKAFAPSGTIANLLDSSNTSQ